MNTDDFPRFRSVLAGMAKLYERELDGPLLDAYWLALGDWSLGDFEQASRRLMATSRFMPRPADYHELRKQAGAMTAGEASFEITVDGYTLVLHPDKVVKG